jgi:hypothetical protein
VLAGPLECREKGAVAMARLKATEKVTALYRIEISYWVHGMISQPVLFL